MTEILSREEADYLQGLLLEILGEARAAQRPAKGAWVKQRLLRRYPSFDESRWGHRSFAFFVRSIPGFQAVHEGDDIVIYYSASPERSRPLERREPRSLNSFDRVAQPLWVAFTRDATAPPAYLDREELSKGRVVVSWTDPISGQLRGPGGGSGNNQLAIPRCDEQSQLMWLQEWAERTLRDDQANEILRQARERGLREATGWLHQQGLAKRWFSERGARTKQALRTWVEANGFSWSAPILEETIRPPENVFAKGSTIGHEAIDLRRLALAAVERMDERDLRQLRIPLGLIRDLLS